MTRGEGTPSVQPTIDQALPSFHHRERHSRWIAAPPEATWEALHCVAFEELPVTRIGLALRRLPARLLGRSDRPPVGCFLDAFQELGFTVFAEEPERELSGA